MRAHPSRIRLENALAAILEYIPLGLLILDWDLRPIWRNNEAANVCAVWNRGEKAAFVTKPRRTFRVPSALARACFELRSRWKRSAPRLADPKRRPLAITEESLGIHAQVEIRRVGGNPLRPVFLVHLDYRRPRGDRNQEISSNALALLDRLSVREREVAMWAREGLQNSEIARRMRVSPMTIKAQLASIYSKLGVHGRTETAIVLNR